MQFHVQVEPLAGVLGQPAEGSMEPQIIEDARSKLLCKRANIFQCMLGESCQVLEFSLKLLPGIVCHSSIWQRLETLAEYFNMNKQRSQILTTLVVQLKCKPAPLLFLCL